MARKRKYTEAQIVAALKKTHGMVYLAAAKLGCDATTIYERAKTSEAIANVLASERGVMLDTAENKLLGAIKKSEPWAIQFALKMLGKNRGYADKPDTLPPPAPSGTADELLADIYAEQVANGSIDPPASDAGPTDAAVDTNQPPASGSVPPPGG